MALAYRESAAKKYNIRNKMSNFDVVTYLGSLVGYPIPPKTVQRIATERGVLTVDDWTQIDKRTRNLVFADLLMYIFTAPNNTGNKSKSHGDYSVSIGGVIIYNKSELYNLMMRLYQHPDEELWEALANIGGCQWME